MDVAKIGLNVEAKGVKQTFEELDKLAKSSSEVSKQMDRLVPLLTKFTNVDLNNQASKIKIIATEMAAFSVECNKMAAAVGGLRVSSAGLNDLKTVLSNLSKISTGGLSKHAENIQKLSTALSSGSALGNASTQLTNLHTALNSLSSTPQTLTQIATAAGSFAGKSTSLNNFVKAVERLAVVSAQLPTIAQQIGTLAPALSNMSGVSAPVAALIAQLKALQGVMNATVNQANAAASQTSGVASRGQGNASQSNNGFGVGSLLVASGIDASITGMANAAKGAVALADEMNNLRAKVGLATSSQAELVAIQAQLLAGSNYVGASLQVQTDAYTQLARSTKSLGLSQSAVADLTTKLAMAHKVGGGSAGSYNSAITQLNQGLASGVLRGQEFNTMAEQAPIVLQALRIGLEKTGVAVGLTEGSLRKMAFAGKLTTDVVIPALQVGLESVKKQFDALPVSVERSMEVLKNNTAIMLDKVNQQTGATVSLSGSLQSMAKFIENNTQLFVTMGNALPIIGVGLLSVALGKTANSAATSFASIGAGAIAAARAEVTLTEATVAQTQAQIRAAATDAERLAAINANIMATVRATEAQFALANATSITTRAATGMSTVFAAVGGWTTVVIGSAILLASNWDKVAASLGNVSAQADKAEASMKRAAAAKSLPALNEVGKELQENLKNAQQKYEEKLSVKNNVTLQRQGVTVSEVELAESKLAVDKVKAQIDENNKLTQTLQMDSLTNNYKAPPQTAAGKLIEDLTAKEQAKLEKGHILRRKYEELKKSYEDTTKTKEAKDLAYRQMIELTTKDESGKTPLEREAAFDKVPKEKAPKGLSAIQSGDSAANAALKEAQIEWNMLQNNTSESLDKLTTSGRKALQIEAQIVEAKKAGSKVSREVIAAKESEFAIYNKAAAIEEKTILRKRQEAEANAELEKTSKILTKNISDTNEFLEARDDLIRSGSVVEVVEADQKKLLSLRKAFMSQLAEIDRQIAGSLSSKETATLIERREGIKSQYDRVTSQVNPAEKFNLKTVEGVKGLEDKSINETRAAYERERSKLAEQMGGASSSDVQLQLGDQYNNSLEEQKQREIDIHASAEEKLRSIEKEKTDRMLSMIKGAESFASSMMDITSKEGQDRLIKEKENFKNQSALYKGFYVMKQAAAIAQATVSGTVMAAEMAAWGASLAGPAGAAAGQALGYGMMAANIGLIAGTTIGMFAKGSAFDGGGVVDSPTAFSHGGGAGVMGEAGPEGVLPLAKGPDGKLGVQTYGGDKSNGGGVSKITIVNQTTGRIDSVEERQISPYEKQIIIKEAIEAVNGNLANPNSSTSKAMNNNYIGMRRNR